MLVTLDKNGAYLQNNLGQTYWKNSYTNSAVQKIT